MKKILTFVAAVMLSIGMNAADKVYALEDMTRVGNTYTSETFSGEKAQNNDVYIELPAANVEGNITFYGQADKSSRFLYIYKEAGTVKDESRPIVMKNSGTTISYTKTDIMSRDDKPYLHFSTTNDFKFIKFEYTAVGPDHTKATVKSISVDGEKLAGFAAETLEYNIELAYGTTIVPTVTAEAGDEATIVVNAATALPGATTVVCTSYDESATVTYTINFAVAATPSTDATLKSISVAGKALPGFATDVYEYSYVLEYDATAAPEVTAVATDVNANPVVTPATAIPGATTILVTAQDGETQLTYTINFVLEDPAPFIRAILTSGSEATVKGTIGGTADVDLSSNLKMDKGKYFGITLAESNTFKEGDSVVIKMSTAGQNYPCLFADKAKTICLFLATETSSALEYTIILPAAAEGITSLYLARDGDDATYKWNPVLKSISVFRVKKDEPIDPTALVNTTHDAKAVKRIVNGQLLIEKNGKIYNALGIEIR